LFDIVNSTWSVPLRVVFIGTLGKSADDWHVTFEFLLKLELLFPFLFVEGSLIAVDGCFGKLHVKTKTVHYLNQLVVYSLLFGVLDWLLFLAG
jgi:hypothetical protein